MFEIIDRNFLPQGVTFFDGDALEAKNYDTFVETMIYWKTLLWEGYGIRPGHSVGVYDKTIRFQYCTLFFALAELGVKMLLIPDYPVLDSGRTDKMDAYLSVHGKVDLFILDNEASKSPRLLALTNYYGKKTIVSDIFNSYAIKDNDVYCKMRDNIYATPDSTITVTTTSGSTGQPKLVSYSHRQLFRNANRNSKVYEFVSHDRACHSRNMHHPYVLIDFFLPALRVVENHYSFVVSIDSATDDEVTRFIDFIKTNQISRLAFSHRPMMERTMDHMISHGTTFEHDFTITLGGQYVPKKYLDYVKKTKISKIIAILGTTETLSPLLIKNITQNTDANTYEENFIGWPPDDNYQYRLENQRLIVSCPDYFDDDITLDDKFQGSVDHGFYHLGRENFYRINHIDFKLSDVINLVRAELDGEFDICMDPHYQNIYLAVWNGTVDFAALNASMQQNLKFQFKDYACLDKSLYTNGFKLDQNLLRSHFREKSK